MSSFEIGYLADHPEMISVCASWAYSQWGCQSGGSLEHSVIRFQTGAEKDKLPLTLIARLDDKPVGMVSLWDSDFRERPDLSPWLASLYVHPFYRNRHIAFQLIQRLENEAMRMGFSELYLVTEEAKGLYAKCGWAEIQQVVTSYGNATLMKKKLQNVLYTN